MDATWKGLAVRPLYQRLAVLVGISYSSVNLRVPLVLERRGMPTACLSITEVCIDREESLDPGVLSVSDDVEFLHMMINLYLYVGPGYILSGSQTPEAVSATPLTLSTLHACHTDLDASPST